MTGTILGFDITTNTGIISGDDSKRYKFSKDDWKENFPPIKESKVDFDIAEDGRAKEIYQVKDSATETSNTLMGLLAVGLTFFFGFIGTLVSRLVLCKQPFGKVVIPTLIHFFITLALIVPLLGWIIYLIGNVYYMVKNYQLVVNNLYMTSNKYVSTK